jgi:hypothetical protein
MSSSPQIAVDEVMDNASKSVRQSSVSGSSVEIAPPSSKTKMWQNAIAPDAPPIPVKLSPVQACLQNKAMIAVAVGLLTAFLLAVVNPPMAQEKSVNDITVPSRSVKKIAAWSLFAALIYFLIAWYIGSRAR